MSSREEISSNALECLDLALYMNDPEDMEGIKKEFKSMFEEWLDENYEEQLS